MTTFFGPPAASEDGIGPLTLSLMLEETAKRYRDSEALVFHEYGDARRLSYGDLDQEARRVAKALLANGVVKGTRIGLLMGNRPEWVISAYGVAMAGGVLVPISTFMTPVELEYVIRHSGISLLLTQDHLLSHQYLDILVTLCPELQSEGSEPLRAPVFPFLRSVISIGIDERRGVIFPFEDFLSTAAAESDDLLDATIDDVDPSDDAVIIYTSGTTARPKAILHSHRAPALQSWRFARWLGLDRDARVWSAYPLFWTAGFTMVMGATLAAGGSLVLQEHFDAGEALRLLESERVTTPHARAHQQAQLEDHADWETRDLSSLRHVNEYTSFTRHATVQLKGDWYNRCAYGLTETFSNFSQGPSDLAPADREGHRGWILPGNSVRIYGDNGDTLPLGQEGEIAVKGTTLMKGYLRVPSEEVFDGNGYFHTGDSGFVDDDGRLHWTGRASLMIKTAGANVSPLEVEEELLKHSGIKVVLALGIPDEQRDELVVACVVAHAGHAVEEDELRSFLKDRLASYKIPRRILFFVDEDFSMTANNARVRSDDMRPLVLERLAAENRGD